VVGKQTIPHFARSINRIEMAKQLRDASLEVNRESWRQYYSSLAESDEGGEFERELKRTAYSHAWANSVRVIAERACVEDGMKVLDAGSGWGRMLLGLLELRSDLDVHAIDVQRDALDLGAKLLSEPPMGNKVSWQVGDLEALEAADGTFDAAYSARVFQHLDHPERGISEIVRVLKPGGRFVVFLQNRLCPLNVRYYAKMYSPGEVRSWFEGVQVQELHVASMDFFPNQLKGVTPRALRMGIERSLERVPLLNRFGGKTIAWGVK